ncbi:CopL family metal-binding regulatory protein [Lysobacter sp. P5_B9]
MSVCAVLLRLLLCLTLVLNGVTAAVAGTHVQPVALERNATPQAASSVSEAGGMPCHHHSQAGASHAAPMAASAETTDKARHAVRDCCKSGSCRCDCVQHAQAAVPVAVSAPVRIAHAELARHVSPVHASPAISHLIRPPIV